MARATLDELLEDYLDYLKAYGGVRERMHTARTEARGESWDKAVYSMLDLCTSPADLEARLAKVVESARRSARSIKRRKGW